jgi:hypothetical protein
MTPREQLVAIHRTITQLFAEATTCWQKQLLPALKEWASPLSTIRIWANGRKKSQRLL